MFCSCYTNRQKPAVTCWHVLNIKTNTRKTPAGLSRCQATPQNVQSHINSVTCQMPDAATEQHAIPRSSLVSESWIPPITVLWQSTWAAIVFTVVVQYIWCVPQLCHKLCKDLNLSRYWTKGEAEWLAKCPLASTAQNQPLDSWREPSPKLLHQHKQNNTSTSRWPSIHSAESPPWQCNRCTAIRDLPRLFVVENVVPFSFAPDLCKRIGDHCLIKVQHLRSWGFFLFFT